MGSLHIISAHEMGTDHLTQGHGNEDAREPFESLMATLDIQKRELRQATAAEQHAQSVGSITAQARERLGTPAGPEVLTQRQMATDDVEEFGSLMAALDGQKRGLRRSLRRELWESQSATRRAERRRALLCPRPPEPPPLKPSTMPGSAKYSFGAKRHSTGKFGIPICDPRDPAYVDHPAGTVIPGVGHYDVPSSFGQPPELPPVRPQVRGGSALQAGTGAGSPGGPGGLGSPCGLTGSGGARGSRSPAGSGGLGGSSSLGALHGPGSLGGPGGPSVKRGGGFNTLGGLSKSRSAAHVDLEGPGRLLGTDEANALIKRSPSWGLAPRWRARRLEEPPSGGPGYDGPNHPAMQLAIELRNLQRTGPSWTFGREAGRQMATKTDSPEELGPGFYRHATCMVTQF